MSKSNPTEDTANVQPADQVTLDEFCQRRSGTDRRVELIAGFHSTEVKAGTTKDTEQAFADRFQAFINKPV